MCNKEYFIDILNRRYEADILELLCDENSLEHIKSYRQLYSDYMIVDYEILDIISSIVLDDVLRISAAMNVRYVFFNSAEKQKRVLLNVMEERQFDLKLKESLSKCERFVLEDYSPEYSDIKDEFVNKISEEDIKYFDFDQNDYSEQEDTMTLEEKECIECLLRSAFERNVSESAPEREYKDFELRIPHAIPKTAKRYGKKYRFETEYGVIHMNCDLSEISKLLKEQHKNLANYEGKSFTEALTLACAQSNETQSAIAQYAEIQATYLNNLIKGKEEDYSIETLIRILLGAHVSYEVARYIVGLSKHKLYIDNMILLDLFIYFRDASKEDINKVCLNYPEFNEVIFLNP